MDKQNGDNQLSRRLRFTEWVRSTGLTASQIDKATGTFMGSHYTTQASQPAIMTRQHLDAVRHLIDTVPDWVETEVDIRTTQSEAWKSRPVVTKTGEDMFGEYEVVENYDGDMGGFDGVRLGQSKATVTAPSTDLAKQWQGFGTALKPAHEPAVLARKPLCGTVTDNVTTWGVGGLNIDGTRIGTSKEVPGTANAKHNNGYGGGWGARSEAHSGFDANIGRWPANVILDEDAAKALDMQSGYSDGRRKNNNVKSNVHSMFSSPHSGERHPDAGGASRFFYTAKASKAEREAGLDGTCTVKYDIDKSIIGGLSWNDVSTVAVQLLQRVTSELVMLKWLIGESGESITGLCPSDSLFITSMEISKTTALKTCNLLMRLLTSESIADANCETVHGSSLAENAERLRAWIMITTSGRTELARGAVSVALTTLQQINEKEPLQRNNFHSTVKPLSLMRYLVRLVTPKGGKVLDPFMGSGSTGCAAVLEGFDFVGIDITPEYVAIAQKRIDHYAVTSPLMNL